MVGASLGPQKLRLVSRGAYNYLIWWRCDYMNYGINVIYKVNINFTFLLHNDWNPTFRNYFVKFGGCLRNKRQGFSHKDISLPTGAVLFEKHN